MWQIAPVLMLLAQSPAPVKIVNPNNQSKAATTTTVGGKEAIDVNCVSGCTGGGGAGGSSGGGGLTWIDGGRADVDVLSIRGPDGGVTLDVTGSSVTVSNFPVTQPVSIASMPSTPVTGTVFRHDQRLNAIQQRISRHLGKKHAFSLKTRRRLSAELHRMQQTGRS